MTGAIPTEFGNLFELDVLSVYMNFLSGPIPTEIGQLGFLRTLVIENNNLTGLIPSEIGTLFSLGMWNSTISIIFFCYCSQCDLPLPLCCLRQSHSMQPTIA